MTRILQINSSIFSDDGVSSQLADDFLARRARGGETLQRIRRDLAKTPIPHLEARVFQAALTPVAERDDDQRSAAAFADGLIDELEWADELVLAVPMYNFAIPSTLKAWFDHVARAHRTFRYTENGPIGLLDGKRARVFATRGGIYDNASDHAVPHLRQFLGFLGIEDIEVVYAEGLALGADQYAQALEQADRAKAQLVDAA